MVRIPGSSTQGRPAGSKLFFRWPMGGMPASSYPRSRIAGIGLTNGPVWLRAGQSSHVMVEPEVAPVMPGNLSTNQPPVERGALVMSIACRSTPVIRAICLWSRSKCTHQRCRAGGLLTDVLWFTLARPPRWPCGAGAGSDPLIQIYSPWHSTLSASKFAVSK